MLHLIEETLRASGDLLLHDSEKRTRSVYPRTPQIVARVKERIVTDDDLRLNDFIMRAIRTQFPHHNIVSEENNDKTWNLMEPTWIIDPIDGSLNFSRGIDYYCISIGHWNQGAPVVGGVYCPRNQELFLAERGAGATLNGRSIAVSQTRELEAALILSSGWESFRHANQETVLLRALKNIGNLRIFSASALDMCQVAAGRADGRIYADCRLWDISAAMLVLLEAGGKVTDWRNNQCPTAETLVASNGLLHEQLLALANDTDNS